MEDYRPDTNNGLGWLVLSEWREAVYEGDPCHQEHLYPTLGEARYIARHLGCVAGVSAVRVAAADKPEESVCSWDKDAADHYWHDEERIRRFEQHLDLTERLA